MELLQGTLDVLILRALARGPRHGYAVSRWVHERTGGALQIEDAPLYKALHRLEHAGCVSAAWGASENNRRARYYRLTAEGRRRLQAEASAWRRYAAAVATCWTGMTGAFSPTRAPDDRRDDVDAELRFHLDARTEALVARRPDARRRAGAGAAGVRRPRRRAPLHAPRRQPRRGRRAGGSATWANSSRTCVRAPPAARRAGVCRSPPSSRSRSASAPTPRSSRSCTASSSARCRFPSRTACSRLLGEPDRRAAAGVRLGRRSGRLARAAPVDRGHRRLFLRRRIDGHRPHRPGAPRRLAAVFVTPGFFTTLGVAPRAAGCRARTSSSAAATTRSSCCRTGSGCASSAASPSVVGSTITLNGVPYDVLGVLPRDFRFPTDDADVFVPYSTIPDSGIPRIRPVRVLSVVARAKPGVTAEACAPR